MRRATINMMLGVVSVTGSTALAQVPWSDDFSDGVVDDSRYTDLIGTGGLSESGGVMRVEYEFDDDGVFIDLSDKLPGCVKIDFASFDLPSQADEPVTITYTHQSSASRIPAGFKTGKFIKTRLPSPPAPANTYRIILELLDENGEPLQDPLSLEGTVTSAVAKKITYDIVGSKIRIEYWDGTTWKILMSADPPDIQPIESITISSSTSSTLPTELDRLAAEPVHVVPALSTWALIVMTVLAMTAATIMLARRRRPAAA